MGRRPTGTGLSFEPREMLRPVAAFGKTAIPLEAAPGMLDSDWRVRAARLQHLVMVNLKNELTYQNIPVKNFAQQQRMSVDRLYRVMRGEALMQVTDLAGLAFAFQAVRKVAIQFLSEIPEPPASTPTERSAPQVKRDPRMDQPRRLGR